MTATVMAAAGGQIPQDALLGNLVLRRVPDASVEVGLARALMQQHGLDPALIPEAPKPVHVFGRACRAVETRRPKQQAKTHREQVDVREVVTNSAESVYQITRVLVDEANRQVDHPKAMRVVHSPDVVRPIHVEPIDPDHYEALAALEGRIRDYYTANLGRVPGAKLREIVRKLLRDSKAVSYGSAADFVPMEANATMAALKAVIEGLYPGEGRLTLIPLLNTDDLRDELDYHHTREIQDEVHDLMADMRERLAQPGNVRQDMLTNKRLQRRMLTEKCERMRELIGKETGAITEAMELLDMQLAALEERAKP